MPPLSFKNCFAFATERVMTEIVPELKDVYKRQALVMSLRKK
jgi:hypothetical protein